MDIKTFADSKKPKSDVQFAAVVAYYYRFEASPENRKETIDAKVLQDAARLAGRRRPPKPLMTLNLERLYRDEAVYRDFARAAHQRCLAPDLRWSAAADALLRGPREGRAEPWPRSGGTASS